MQYLNKDAFSLLELIIVIMIISVLLLVAVPGFMRTVERSRGTSAYAMLDALKKIEHFYYSKYGSYAGLSMDIEGTVGGAENCSIDEALFMVAEIPELPQDKFWRFDVHVSPDGSAYNIVAKRYNEGDEDFRPEYIWFAFDGTNYSNGSRPVGAY